MPSFSDSQQSHSDRQPIIRAKYSKFIQNFKIFGFEFCNNLLSSSRLRGFDKNESTVFEGYLLLSHVRILIFVTNVECFGNNGHNEEVSEREK
jgi:hypothetical protein